MFIDREDELSDLEKRYNSKSAEFIVLYGRRRVGKSELIDEFVKGRNGIRLLAREESRSLQLRGFSERLSAFFGDELLKKNPFSDWDSFFLYIERQAAGKRIVIAIDEFPYLVTGDSSLPSIIQDHWDRALKNSRVFLILCGSSIRMMEDMTLSYTSPLYGRRTGQIRLRPFRFSDVSGSIGKDIKSAIELYAVFGGTPAYILSVDKKEDVSSNVRNLVLRTDSFLYGDIEFLLREELNEPRYYFSILYSVAKGSTKLSEIINDTGLERGTVAKYLSVLSDMDFIKREVPVTEDILRSRNGIYRLRDNFFRFWFRYVYPHKEEVENGSYDAVSEAIDKDRPLYTSRAFEEICTEALELMHESHSLPKIGNAGRWWYKDTEIDIIGVNDSTQDIILAECKWSRDVDAERLLNSLKEKAQKVLWNRKTRKEHYVLFAQSFKNKNVSGARLLDLEDIAGVFKKHRAKTD